MVIWMNLDWILYKIIGRKPLKVFEYKKEIYYLPRKYYSKLVKEIQERESEKMSEEKLGIAKCVLCENNSEEVKGGWIPDDEGFHWICEKCHRKEIENE